MKIEIINNNPVTKYDYKITVNKIKRKINDDIRIYYSYLVYIPLEIIPFVCDNDMNTYFYEYDGHIFMTSKEPDPIIKYQRRKIYKQGKNHYRLSLPQKLFYFDSNNDNMIFEYSFYLSVHDFINKNSFIVECTLKT